MIKTYSLYYFIENEKKGIKYCKVGKSQNCNYVKGANLPYYNFINKVVDESSNGQITFEEINTVLQYLHYGDQLVILNFTKGENLLTYFECNDNGNKGCYDANKVFVENVLDFSNPKTIDYIIQNVTDYNIFEPIARTALYRLKSVGYNESAKLLEKSLNRTTSSS